MSHVHVQCVGPLARSSLLGAHCPGFLVLLCMPITSHTAAGLRFDPPWSIPEACSHDWMRCAHHRAPGAYKGGRSKCQWNNKKSRNQQKNNSKSSLSLSLCHGSPSVVSDGVLGRRRVAVDGRSAIPTVVNGTWKEEDASGGALKMPRTCSWVSGLVLLLPPPPAGSPRNVFLLVTCRRRPGTQIRPPRLRRRVRAWRLPRCTIQA